MFICLGGWGNNQGGGQGNWGNNQGGGDWGRSGSGTYLLQKGLTI